MSAGMDLRTEEACEATFKEIDEIVGLMYLKVCPTCFIIIRPLWWFNTTVRFPFEVLPLLALDS